MEAVIAIVIAYLLGSVNCAILICKYLKLEDPRKQGSGNPGATNVLRVAGKNAAIATLVGDALKGFIAVLIGRILALHGFELGLVALAAFLGHVYPVFFKFKGGKGVATALGGLLCLNLLLGVVVIVIWLAVAFVTRYSSLAALVAGVLAPVMSLVFAHPQYFIPLVLMAISLVYNHRENIKRLRDGKEGKIKLKKADVVVTVTEMAEKVHKPHDNKEDQ